ncbi:hypothetical protein CsatB_015915 [Cannabis sativa]
MMMMMKSLIIFLFVVNNIGWCYGIRVAHSVTIIPSSNDRCYIATEYCSALPWQLKFCCEGLVCSGSNTCVKDALCTPNVGDGCALFTPCCYPNICSGTTRGSICMAPRSSSTSTPSPILSLDHVDE